MMDAGRLDDATARAEAHAPFLRGLIGRRPEVVAALRNGGLPAALALGAEDAAAHPPARAVRRERQAVALAVALADLAGAPLDVVTAALTGFADRALDLAIRAALAERGEPAGDGFVALALGKQGSGDLNYSSDIDPILLYDPIRLPRRPREEPAEAASRVARRVVELLQTRDADGYALRVDLRLRPSPEATPPALPVSAAIAYYESSALPWERAAFIKARAAAGDIDLGRDFLDAVRPFVWRRALDFGAIREIRGISARIRGHHRGQAFGPGYDVKRGRGGIREIEFFAQIHQLIHGGREPTLRVPGTLPALAALAAAGRIDPGHAEALATAYRVLRTVEHRLQMVDDRQTHMLPADPAALDNVARLHGLPDGAALLGWLEPHVRAVGRIYDALEPERRSGLPLAPDAVERALADAGFPEAAQARIRIEALRAAARPALRSAAAQDALEALLPGLVAAFGGSADPARALNRFDDLVAGLPSAVNLFRLLEQNPALARLVGDILALAPALAEALGRRPALLDRLIDASAFRAQGDAAAIAAALRAGGEADEDYQALLDRVRRDVGERRFALGAQIVAGTADPLEIAAGYAALAEAALAVLTEATEAEFARAHGRVPEAALVVLALGRLGGAALTHASDLDLVYLFTGDHMADSDGAKPLGATLYFNRLAQRVTAALSVATAAGPLYPVDTRLRPSGKDGLLAVSVDSFARYQRDSAWTWEHMALTRGRVVHGPSAAVEAVIAEVLRRPRDRAALVADAAAMRAEMAAHKPPAGPLDVKLVEGGLVDAEFAIHVAQLAHGAALTPRLGAAARALAAAGLVPPDLPDAHDLLTRMLVVLRLVSPDLAEPTPAAAALAARACGHADWAALLDACAAARHSVSRAWAAARETGSC